MLRTLIQIRIDMSEINWYIIPGFSSYQISDNFQVKSNRTSKSKFMKPTKEQVTLRSDEGNKVTMRLPRLLFAAKNNINPMRLCRTGYIICINNGEPCLMGKDEYRSFIVEQVKERRKSISIDSIQKKYQECIDGINSIKCFLETGDSSRLVTMLYSREDIFVGYILNTLHVTNIDVAKDIFRDAIGICLDTIMERKRVVTSIYSYMRAICRSLYARRMKYKIHFKDVNHNEERRVV